MKHIGYTAKLEVYASLFGDTTLGESLSDKGDEYSKGDFLLGMELASDIFSYFLIDFINEKVELETR